MTPAPERTLTPPTTLEDNQLDNSHVHRVSNLLAGVMSANATATKKTTNMVNTMGMKHSVSMLEMNELDDMRQFLFRGDGSDRSLGEECHGGLLGADAMCSSPSESLPIVNAVGQEEDDFLFIDADEDEGGDTTATTAGMEGGLYKLGPNSSTSNTNSGGMRRVQSMGAMTIDPNKFSLLTSMAPDIHTIHEDYDSDDDEDIHIVTPPNNHYYSQDGNGEEQIVQVNFGPTTQDDDEKDSSHRSNKSRRSSTMRIPNPLRSSLNSSTHSALSSSSHHNLLSTSSHSLSHPKKSCLKKSPSTSTLKRSTSNVSFGSLEIRSYAITAGDAPTPNGVPLSLDWDHDPTATQTIDINTYEANRGERRNKSEMYVPNQYRVYLLMRDAGMSRRQIQNAIEESQRAFKGRQKTMKNLKMQPVEEVVERTKRRFGKMKRRMSLGG